MTVQPSSLLSPKASESQARRPARGIRSPWVSLVPLRSSPEGAHGDEISLALPATRSLRQLVVSYSGVICAVFLYFLFIVDIWDCF